MGNRHTVLRPRGKTINSILIRALMPSARVQQELWTRLLTRGPTRRHTESRSRILTLKNRSQVLGLVHQGNNLSNPPFVRARIRRPLQGVPPTVTLISRLPRSPFNNRIRIVPDILLPNLRYILLSAMKGGGQRARTRSSMIPNIVNVIVTATETENASVTMTGPPAGTGEDSTRCPPHPTAMKVLRTAALRISTPGPHPRTTSMEGLPPQPTLTPNNRLQRHLHTHTHPRLNREPWGAHRGTVTNPPAIREQRPIRTTFRNHPPTASPSPDIFPRQLLRNSSSYLPPRLYRNLNNSNPPQLRL